MNFSVVLIAKNESKTLPRLMASLTEFQQRGGEVVLVDTGSTDGTVEVARALGCNVTEVGDRFIRTLDAQTAEAINTRFVVSPEDPIVKSEDRMFDYSAARNYAATLSSKDMIATPDCDEEYTKLDLDAVNKAIEQGAEQLEYNFVFAHDEFGAELVKFAHCKFYDRRKLKWKGIIHEVLTGSASYRPFLPETVIKLEHWQNPIQNREGYLRGLALDCFLNPTNDRNSHYFGRELLYKGRYCSAIKELTRHMEMKAWPAERAQSMVHIGDCYEALGEVDTALDWWHRGFLADGSRREPLMRLAHHFYKIGDHQKTAAYASAALTIPWNGYYGNRADHYTQAPHEMLYWSLWDLDRAQSKKHWEAAIKLQPLSPKYLNASQFYLQPELSLPAFTKAIRENVNFGFVKMGDGEQAAMAGQKGQTCDGQKYSPELGKALRDAYASMAGQCHVVHWTDQGLVNMLLHRKPNDLTQLKDFWLSIRQSKRPKVLVGPSYLRPIALLLRASFIEVSPDNAFADVDSVLGGIAPHSIYLFSAGPAAKLMIAQILKAHSGNVTCLDCGSAFDPICGIQSRTEQYSHAELLDLYSDWFDEDKLPPVSICIPTLGREDKLASLLAVIPRTTQYPRFEIVVERDSFESRQGAPKTLNAAVAKSRHDLVLFLGNDCIPINGFLRQAVIHYQKHFGALAGLVGLNDGFWKRGEIATHWLASKRLLTVLGGEFFHAGYAHVGCDNELTSRCRKLKAYSWCEKARIQHQTPAQSGSTIPWDDVYKLAWEEEAVAMDRALLASRSKEYHFDVT